MAAPPTTASELSKNPHFPPSSTIQPTPSKSHFCKSLIVLVLLIAIPLFPSQAPDFVTETLFTEFWEIIHLVFIGIAVSYGLFSRRTAPEKIAHSRINDDSDAYLSGISHLSSIFEDQFDNVCVNDGVDVMQSYADCECLQESGGEFLLGKDKCVVHGSKKIRSFSSDHGTNDFCDGNVESVNQSWCSQYSKGESLVVVSNGKYDVLGGTSDFKPLNLPVRSLRSRVVENVDKPELKYRRGDESISKIEGKSKIDANVVKIRGVAPMNLEKKFEQNAVKPSIPWRSRSGRMEYGDEMMMMMGNLKLPIHSRPHSVGEFEFEHVMSRPFKGSKISSSSSDLANSEMEYERVSLAKTAPQNGEASNTQKIGVGEHVERERISLAKTAPQNGEASKTRKCSIGEYGENGKVGKGKQVDESLEPDRKPLAKVLSKAKSVRTIKRNRSFANQKEGGNKFEVDSLARRGKGKELENPPFNLKNQELDRIFPVPKPQPTLLEEKEDTDGRRNAAGSEEDSDSQSDKIKDEDDRTNIENDDAELEGSEVDRKAGEFIAKFREQIRRQKISLV